MLARFVIAWMVISAIVVYDLYLTVKHMDVMGDLNVELNPLGSLIIQSNGGVPLLVAIKSLGMVLALLFAFVLWQREPLRRKLLGCSYFVAALQLMLLTYLVTDFVGMQVRGLFPADVVHNPSRIQTIPVHGPPSPDPTEVARTMPGVPKGPSAGKRT